MTFIVYEISELAEGAADTQSVNKSPPNNLVIYVNIP